MSGTDLMILRPSSFAELQEWATTFAPSMLVPESLRNKPGDVAIVLMSGAELGIPPMQALRQLYVVKGRVTMAAEMMRARCLARSECEYFICNQTDAKQAVFEAKRKGAPRSVVLGYTMEQAVRAGLTSNPSWKAHPEAMLVARASAALARIVFPDLVGGIYAREELEGTEDFTLDGGQVSVNRASPLAAGGTTAPPEPTKRPAAPEVVTVDAEVVNPVTGEVHSVAPAAGRVVDATHEPERSPSALIEKLGRVRTDQELAALVPELAALPKAEKEAPEMKRAYGGAKRRANEGASKKQAEGGAA